MHASLQGSLPFNGEQRARLLEGSMRRQGLVGWVLFHPTTGIILHRYRTLAAAEREQPAQSAFHGVAFRVLAIHEGGTAYEHVEGRATTAALDASGTRVVVPMTHGRIEARRLRRYVEDKRRA
jgi:hypothetical protein